MANGLPGDLKDGDLTSPRRGAFAITPADGSDLSKKAYGLYVGGAGDVAVHMVNEDAGEEDTSVVFAGCPAGMILPIIVRRVLSTGTTATNLIGLVP
jgi:hypothetical protein